MDRLYEIKGTLKLMSKPFVLLGKTYVQGVKSFVPVTKRALRGIKIAKRPAPVGRPARNYAPDAITRARALFPKEFISVMKNVGISEQDPFIAHLRAIPVAIASQSFTEVWDGAMDDERLTDSEKESLAVQTLEMLEKDLRLEGVL